MFQLMMFHDNTLIAGTKEHHLHLRRHSLHTELSE